MAHVLWQISFSPWSQRARWALDHAEIPYVRREYLMGRDTPGLRWRTGNWSGNLSVPILVPDDGPAVADSAAIATWAGQRRPDRDLRTTDPAVAALAAAADTLMSAGRIRTTVRTAADPAALHAMLPPWARPLGPVGRGLGRAVTGDLLRRYNREGRTTDDALRAMRDALVTLETARAGRPFLDGDALSWADLSAAVALQFVRPPPTTRLAPAAQAAWTERALAEEFADLLTWRDGILPVPPPRRG